MMTNDEIRGGFTGCLQRVCPCDVEVKFDEFGDIFVRADLIGRDLHWSPNLDAADLLAAPTLFTRRSIEENFALCCDILADAFARALAKANQRIA